ncbi:MAG: magnesium transporter CorA family protein [Acetobacteraceae bacterium]|nr:magnesium transporter CorA family protein [Acetobacteraceae bacterium]
MITAYREIEGRLARVGDLKQEGIWIDVVAPAPGEIEEVSAATGLLTELLQAALDEKERPRIQTEGDQVLVIISVPVGQSQLTYVTVPLGIVVSPSFVATVSLQETEVVSRLAAHARVHTAKRTRLLLQLMLRTAMLYLDYLERLDRLADEVERRLRRSMANERLFELLEVQKSLVYFATGLRSNQLVMEKLTRSKLKPPGQPNDSEGIPLRLYPDDEDVLEDAMTENQQAIMIAEVHNSILSGTMDAFASIISNNLNIVVKFLTAVTIVLAVPTMIASIYGMNVALPGQGSPLAFLGVVGASALATLLSGVWLWKRGMF